MVIDYWIKEIDYWIKEIGDEKLLYNVCFIVPNR